ncbi:MAG: TlpA family protein disulfide reductase, partial [Chitinophagaceae bacterium]
MNIFKPSVLFILFAVLIQEIHADIPKDLVKKILKATAALETYSVSYKRQFKYPNETDTVSELYHSSISRTDVDMYVGWHTIAYSRSNTPRSVAAANNQEIARLNYKENLYYAQSYKDNPTKFISNLNTYLYQPFLYSKTELDEFYVSAETSESYILTKSDTTKDQKQRVTLITKTNLTIAKKSFLPVKESVVSVRNGRTQFAAYELQDVKILPNTNYTRILSQADSFLLVIKLAPNGDSLKASRKDLYKKLKIGDTMTAFAGKGMDGADLTINASKDSILIFDFFYTTCAPCIAAIPELNKVHEQYKNSGISVIGINPFNTDWDHLPNFINDHSVAYQVIKTEKQVVYDYGVTGYPRLIVIKN